MLSSRRSQLLLLAAVIFVVFSPAIFAKFSTTDDTDMVDAYRKMNGPGFKEIFVPGSGGGLYYRPALGTSFFIDKYLLRFNPALMHIENILIHFVTYNGSKRRTPWLSAMR